MRIKIFRLIVFALFVMLICELFYIQIVRGRYYHQLSLNNRIRVVPLNSYRGRIFDRNGVVVANNRLAYNIQVVPQDVKDEDELFAFLSKVLDVPVKEIAKRYENRRFSSFAPVVVAEDVGEDKIVVIEENRYRFPSLLVEESFRRLYPFADSLAHLLGYVSKISPAKLDDLENSEDYGMTPESLIGYSGVEEYYDKLLQGDEGGVQIEVNSRGQQVRMLSYKEPRQGEDIYLTVDSALQERSFQALAGRRGAVIVMDAKSGEILSLVSSPSYNPNVFSDSFQNSRLNQIFSNPNSPLVNRAIKSSYPPGSVFKVIMAIAGLDTKKINEHSSFVCDGALELGGITFRCEHVHGAQDLLSAIAHSCNIYFYHLGLLMGVDPIVKYAKMFGLSEKTNIDLPYEDRGHLPGKTMKNSSAPRRWYAGETVNTSIGQGDVLATPLQLASMMAMVYNDGFSVHPHVLLSDTLKAPANTRRHVNIDEEIFDTVKVGLRRTVTDPSGTANVLSTFEDIYIAGKTGTAQSGKDREPHSWFVCYATRKDKTYIISAFLEHGGSSYNACVLTKEILNYMRQSNIL